MEIRANYILVGLFSLLVMGGVLCTILWLNMDNSDNDRVEYDIRFRESVRGLSVGNPVLFSGIRVGQVRSLTISREEPGAVKVRVAIQKDTPVRKNSEASLDMMGLTGGSIVVISGGTAASPLVTAKEGFVPVIHARQSPLGAVMKDVPATLATANSVLENLNTMFGRENQESFNTIMLSLATVSSSLANQSGNLEGVIQEAHITLVELNKILKTSNKTIQSIDTMVSGLSPEMKRFSQEGLPQIQLLLTEGRAFVRNLTLLTQQIESDPSRFFFGDRIQQFKPE